jgi:DNA-binding PadR family transcriptional regulator
MWHLGMFGGKRRGLRMWVLFMLRSKPRNGVEIMDEMEGMSQGWWRPSPGSVYPLLDELRKEGYLQKRDDGRYELTAKAGEELNWGGPPWMGGRWGHSIQSAVEEIGAQLSFLEESAPTAAQELEGARGELHRLAERLEAISRGRQP